jgi:hypothetical protein
MDNQFLTAEELLALKDINEKRNQLTTLFGSLEFDLQTILLEKNKVVDQLKEISEASEKIATQLQEKYGEGNVNIETGEFIKR